MTTPAQTAYDDQLRRRMTEAIRRYACWVTVVSDDVDCPRCALEGDNRQAPRARAHRHGRGNAAAPFAYTTGLHGIGHPELVLFGVHHDIGTRLLTALAHEVLHGGDLTPGELVDTSDVGGPILRVETLTGAGRILTYANWYYQRPASASVNGLRLTVADSNQII